MFHLNFRPRSLIEVTVQDEKTVEFPKPAGRFSVMSWNIQYSAGRNYHFWYDGGKDVHVKNEDVRGTLKKISETIRRQQPDILILQEVDRDSKRTGRIDQLPWILKEVEMNSWSSTPYHRSRFVPAPLGNPLGRVDMHMAIASKYKISSAVRYALPGLNENFIRRDFNLKRALLEAAIPTQEGKQPLIVMNTHLSAFSYGDGTLERQISLLKTRLKELDDAGYPWILAGDFNMIPPGDDPERLGKESVYYRGDSNPLEELFMQYKPDVDLKIYTNHPGSYFTYLKYGEPRADRKIDYIFSNKNVDIQEFSVIREEDPSSDHLPLFMEVSIK